MKNKQTAVEWLMENLHTAKDPFKQAKEMEKQQIKNAYKADVTMYPIVEGIYESQAEQYYNETYGTK